MPQDSDQEKTEQATPKKLEDMRGKGQVAKSREVPSVAVLVASLIAFYFLGASMVRQLMELMQWSFGSSLSLQIEKTTALWLAVELFKRLLSIMAPLLTVIVVAALASNYLQVGFLFSLESVSPKFSKLDPIKGFGKIFSKQSLVELTKNIFKIAVVGCVA